MIVNRSIEHGVLVVLMLALQEGHRPVSGSALSAALGVSDSYLKKNLRKLVVANIVTSSATREGGFALARPANEITLGDVYRALDGPSIEYRSTSLAYTLFPDQEHTAESKERLSSALSEAHDAFLSSLDGHPITELLKEGAWQKGCIDWASKRDQ